MISVTVVEEKVGKPSILQNPQDSGLKEITRNLLLQTALYRNL